MRGRGVTLVLSTSTLSRTQPTTVLARSGRVNIPVAGRQLRTARVRPAAAATEAPPAANSQIILNGQILHSITSERLDLVKTLGSFVATEVCGGCEVGGERIAPQSRSLSNKHNAHTTTQNQQVQPLLKPVDKCWQPADFLPDSSDPDFMDKVRRRLCFERRAAAASAGA